MHPSLRGQLALAQAILQALQGRRAFGWPDATSAPVIDPARCAAHFGIGPDEWRSVCLWEQWFHNVMAPLRYDPSQRHQKGETCAVAADRIAAGAAPEVVGLANVGIPPPVPVAPDRSGR
jgi:hypothetical protein